MIKIIYFIIALFFTSLTTTLVYHKTQQGDIYYYQAHRLFAKGNLTKAIPLYKKSLSVNPARLDALRELAYSCHWTGKRKEAIGYFRKAISLNPKDLQLKKTFAQALSWDKEYGQAIAVYRELLAVKDDYETRNSLVEILIWNKQFNEAEASLRGMLKESPDDLRVKFLLANLLLYTGRPQEAARIYEGLLKQGESLVKGMVIEESVRELLGESYAVSGDYEKAIEAHQAALELNPSDVKAMVKLADVASWQQDYVTAIAGYKKALLIEPDNADIKRKMADVFSWSKQYAEAIALYDELLKTREDKSIRLQKARVLGWMKRYNASLGEYKRTVDESRDPLIELEMKAKEAYWNNRVSKAVGYYKELIAGDPRNAEAMFDLAQIYSYQSMWEEATAEYKKIIDLMPGHFRAREGLEKAGLISSHVSLEPGYEFYEADSSARIDDIKRYSFFSNFIYPLEPRLNFNFDYRLTNRLFHDFGDILENEGRFRVTYINNPGWWADAFYDLTVYNKDGIDPMHVFGASHAFRFFDSSSSRFSYERQRLENTSTVVREHYYSDNFKERIDIDINRRLKAGMDYLFANYSDGNNRHEPGIDILFFLSLDPQRLTLKYRYFYKNFLRKVNEYFSPKGFSTNSLKINWRHYLNKEEIFFGAEELYYDLAYECSVDSTGIASNKFSAEFNWDINKRLNLNIRGSNTESSAGIYKDRNIIASLNYYF